LSRLIRAGIPILEFRDKRGRGSTETAKQPESAQISGIWGSGLDTLLAAVRKVINEHGSDGCPAEHLYEVMAKRGKGLLFADAEIDEVVEMQYGDKRCFCIRTGLFHFVEVANNKKINT